MEKYQIRLGRLKKLSRRMNSGLSLFLVIRGRVRLEADGLDYDLNEGGLAVIGNMEIFSMESDGSSVVLSLLFPREYLSDVFPEALKRRILFVSPGGFPEDSDDTPLRRLAAGLAFSVMRKAPGYELKVQAGIFELFHCIFTGIAGRENRGALETTGTDGRLASVLADLHQNFRYNLTLQEEAGKEFLSPQYLSRLFKEKMGVTFLEYLNGLRLSEAEKALLQSEEGIARIAMDSGFPSEKAFSRQFRKKFGMTPSEYRRIHYIGGNEDGSRFEQMEEVSLEAFVKFVGTYTPEVQKERTRSEQIDMTAEPKTVVHENMIDIGNVWLALREDTRGQLEQAQKILNCRFVRLTMMETPEFMGTGDKVSLQYDYYYVFSLFYRLKLIPFIHVRLADLKPAGMFDLFCSIMENLKRRNDRRYFREWRIELEGGEAEPELLGRIMHAIKKTAPQLAVGLTVDMDRMEGETLDFFRKTCGCGEHCADGKNGGSRDNCAGLFLDFLAVRGDPNQSSAPREPEAFEHFQRNYYPGQMKKLRLVMDKAGLAEVPVYLVEWNTLTGATVAEAGEFHRTALIGDVMCSLMEDVAGFGFWLSLFGPKALRPELCTYPLSLYFYQDVPRPLLFAAQSLGGGKMNVIYKKEDILCMKNSGGEYVLVLFNPCYQDPFRSMDNVIQERLSCTFELHLKGLEAGEYYFKRYVLDKRNGSLYHNWVNVDFNLARYEDVASFLKGAVAPALTMYRQKEMGEVILKPELAMNAMMVYIIGKMEPSDAV